MPGDNSTVAVTYIEHDGTEHSHTAEAGTSLMQLAVENLVPGIDGDCGGECRCATCHCYIDQPWLDKLGPASEDELLMLEGAIDPQPNSRLGCQVKLDASLNGIRVFLPET